MEHTVYLILLGIALAGAAFFGVVTVLTWIATPVPVY
jgi:hypothetical protein